MIIPDQVPVMTLPNAVLFPRILLPLHIFEPRYRKMLADCLTGSRMFAVALSRKDEETADGELRPYPIACVGVIRACVGNPNGTSNLVLQGLARVRNQSYVKTRPYRLGVVRVLKSTGARASNNRMPLIEAINGFIKARSLLGQDVPAMVRDSLLAVDDVELLGDLAGFTFLEDEHEKQRVLATLNVKRRQELLVDILRRQTEQQHFLKSLQGDLPNDHVGFN